MPSLDPRLISRIIQKYGDTLDLRANPEVLNDIVREIDLSAGIIKPGEIDPVAGYDKTYIKDFDKVDYDKERYSQYDKTVDDELLGGIAKLINPEILERYRSEALEELITDRKNIKGKTSGE